MLVDFSVKNYRSIKEEIVLSMLSTKVKKSIKNDIEIDTKTKLLPVAVIYGQNAAGKTNIVKAMDVMKALVTRRVDLPVELIHKIAYTPFAFSQDTIDAPIKFNINILVSSKDASLIPYEYGFVLSKTQILAEWLYSGAKTIFTREWTEPENEGEAGSYNYKYPNNNLTDNKQLRELWEKSTRPEALFLSLAANLNSEAVRPVYDWFLYNLDIINRIDLEKSISYGNTEDGKNEIIKFLQVSDIAITDVEANVKDDFNSVPPHIKQVMESFQKSLGGGQVQSRVQEVKFKHPTDYNDGYLLEIKDESEGTKKMYALAGYWQEAIKNNKVIIFDELNNSLHPNLLKFLVNKINLRENNTRAQLVFTSHDTHLINQKILNRDQIWICGRDREQATNLHSLVEFKVRTDISNYEQAYLQGRFGGVPILEE